MDHAVRVKLNLRWFNIRLYILLSRTCIIFGKVENWKLCKTGVQQNVDIFIKIQELITR